MADCYLVLRGHHGHLDRGIVIWEETLYDFVLGSCIVWPILPVILMFRVLVKMISGCFWVVVLVKIIYGCFWVVVLVKIISSFFWVILMFRVLVKMISKCFGLY